MPPRYAYWTILVDEQPTAFRAGSLDDLMPTFKRLQTKHPSARLVWFQNGKVWKSRLDAQEAMRVRGERGLRAEALAKAGRGRDARQRSNAGPPLTGGQGGRRDDREKLEWKPKSQAPRPSKPDARERRDKSWRPGPSTRDGLHDAKPAARSGLGRDKNWRPGGEHKDPRQKYKDAKKAKWTRFKQNIRKRWEAKPGKTRQ